MKIATLAVLAASLFTLAIPSAEARMMRHHSHMMMRGHHMHMMGHMGRGGRMAGHRTF